MSSPDPMNPVSSYAVPVCPGLNLCLRFGPGRFISPLAAIACIWRPLHSHASGRNALLPLPSRQVIEPRRRALLSSNTQNKL